MFYYETVKELRDAADLLGMASELIEDAEDHTPLANELIAQAFAALRRADFRDVA
jgi:hypothetical protein